MSRTPSTRPLSTTNKTAQKLPGQPMPNQTFLEDRQSIADLMTGWIHRDLAQWDQLRAEDPQRVAREARQSMARHVEAMLKFQGLGIPVFDYGNNIRQVALDEGVSFGRNYV